MNSVLKINQFAFNEKEMARNFLEFKEKAVRTVVNTLIEKQTVIELFKIIMKYLYNEYNLSADEILYYVHKYSVVICYYYTSSLKDERLYNEDIEEMLKNPLTLKDLNKEIEGKGLYVTWFNKSKSYKEYNARFDYLLKTKDNKLKKKIYAISRIGSYEYNFFTPNTDLTSFINKDKMRRYDMLLAEVLADPSYFSFDFQIDEENMKLFIQNIEKVNNERLIYSYVLMGLIAHELISNNNLDYSKNIHLVKSSLLRIMSLKRKASFALNFVDKLNEELIPKNIIPFNFNYNGKTYKFTQKSILE